MIDASHNLKDPLVDLLESVEAIMIAYTQALLVDRDGLQIAQKNNDIVKSQQILQNAFRTDVRSIVAQARLLQGGALDPIALFDDLKIRQALIQDRGSNTKATGL